MIEFECTNCGKTLRAGDEHAGKTATCNGCHAKIKVPVIDDPPPPPPPEPIPEPPAFEYASTPITRRKAKTGAIWRYHARVGHRSFIFQVWLAAWTLFYLMWLVSVVISLNSHAPAGPPNPFGPAPSPSFNPIDMLAGATSGWICLASGWGLVGLPVGIAAVATMENNKG